MTARSSSFLALGLGLASIAAGCTVHTYSAGTTYPRPQPVRYEVSYRSDGNSSEQPRSYALPRKHAYAQPQALPSQERTRDRSTHFATRDAARRTAKEAKEARSGRTTARQTASDHLEQAEPQAREQAKADEARAPAPRVSATDESAPVTLEPVEPKANSGRVRSFEERLGELIEQKKQQLEREKKARRTRMERAIGAAADKHGS